MKDNKFIAQPFVPKTETRIVLENQQKPKLSLAVRSKIVNKSGSNYQSSLAEIGISTVKGYGPSSDDDTQWTSLYISCPASGCSNTTVSYWHHSSGLNASDQSSCGELEISNKGKIKCSSCGTSSATKNWKFECSDHRGKYKATSSSSFSF